MSPPFPSTLFATVQAINVSSKTLTTVAKNVANNNTKITLAGTLSSVNVGGPLSLAPLTKITDLTRATIANISNANIPKDKLVYNINGVQRYNNTLGSNFYDNYLNQEPQIICIVDYIVNEKKIGVLIIFEKYFDSTHYEIFKRNIFQFNSDFERIIYLDNASLFQETSYYNDYLTNYVGLNLQGRNVYVVFDPFIKDDRIYEFYIRATRLPTNFKEVDYNAIVKSKNIGQFREVIGSSKLLDFSLTTLQSSDLSWIICLLNPSVPYFGRAAIERTLLDLISPSNKLLYISDLNIIMNIIRDSMSLFGVPNTFERVISLLGGLTPDFIESFNISLNLNNFTFSYNQFLGSLRQKIPVLNVILNISEHSNNADALSRLSKLSINIPNVGYASENLLAIEGLSKIFKFINAVYLSIIYSQEQNIPQEIQDLLDTLNTPPPKPTPSPPVSKTVVLSPAIQHTVTTNATIVPKPLVNNNNIVFSPSFPVNSAKINTFSDPSAPQPAPAPTNTDTANTVASVLTFFKPR